MSTESHTFSNIQEAHSYKNRYDRKMKTKIYVICKYVKFARYTVRYYIRSVCCRRIG